MLSKSINLTRFASVLFLAFFMHSFFCRKAIAEQSSVNPALSQEIAKCPDALTNATVFIHDSTTNKTGKFGKIIGAVTGFGELMIGENCYLQMIGNGGEKLQLFLLSDGRSLLLTESQRLADVVSGETPVRASKWNVIQSSSKKLFRVRISEKYSLLLPNK